MLQPLEEYICDYCYQKISQPSHAEIVWNYLGDTDTYDAQYGNYKLVHKQCGIHQVRGYDCNAGIDHFLDFFLLTPHAHNLQEYLHLIRRLTVPYYEEARICMQRRGVDAADIEVLNILEPNSEFYETIVMMESTGEW